jgi:acetate kinase
MSTHTAAGRVVVLNAGTATLKVATFEIRCGVLVETQRAEHAWLEQVDGPRVVRDALEEIERPIAAIGHRVVHGGDAFTAPVRIDSGVEEGIVELVALAPLHNARALEVIRGARRLMPEVPSFAVFDTAFHAERPRASLLYALPQETARALKLRRYGFHGIAHASLLGSLAAAEARDVREVTAVTLQLGSGCSACAVRVGRSIETSMGYTPLDGLVMATRCGSIDPAIVLQMLRAGHAVDEIDAQLNRQSGLLALSGCKDMRDILAAEARGDDRARLAIEVFVHRIVLTVGAYFTLLEGRGALVFGGGIGTNSHEIRARVAAGLRAWDVDLDPQLNTRKAPGRISAFGSRAVYVFRTNEEHLIAQELARLLAIPQALAG